MLIFDIETNGLLYNVDTIHCLVIYDTETNKTNVFNDQAFIRATNQPTAEPIVRGIQLLEDADLIAGHNIIGYDMPVLRKLYPWFGRIGDCLDTLLLSRLYHPDLMNLDKRHNWEGMPLKLYGSHSLEAYGYRLKENKGEFSKSTDWQEWCPDMQNYCIQDVKVTTKLWKHFLPYLNGSR
jgi:hypothetical protein